MGDPYKTFREEAEWRRESLKTIWPELYADLAQLGQPRKAWGCAMAPHIRVDGTRDYVPVVGRVWLNGPPACRGCLDRSGCKRPGGFPLELKDPREWKA